MGAWGTAAYDNDTAADWFGDSKGLATLGEEIRTTLARGEHDGDIMYDQWRAAAWLLSRVGTIYVWPEDPEHLIGTIALAIFRLERIVADTAWAERWTDPTDILAEVHKDLEVLRAHHMRWSRG